MATFIVTAKIGGKTFSEISNRALCETKARVFLYRKTGIPAKKFKNVTVTQKK